MTIAFPLRSLVERDIRGAGKAPSLFAEVMGLTERVTVYMDGNGRLHKRELTGETRTAYLISSGRLTSRLVTLASVMMAARDWLETGATERIRKVALQLLQPHDGKWWSPLTPDDLVSLCVIADALGVRVRGAQHRLLNAMQAETREAA